MVGQAFGFRWQPYDAGAPVAGAELLSAVCAWLLSPAWPPLARIRIWGAAWPLAGLVLTAVGDMHGPPLLLGFGPACCCCGGTGIVARAAGPPSLAGQGR